MTRLEFLLSKIFSRNYFIVALWVFSLTTAQVLGLCRTGHCTTVVFPEDNSLHAKSGLSERKKGEGLSERQRKKPECQ